MCFPLERLVKTVGRKIANVLYQKNALVFNGIQ